DEAGAQERRGGGIRVTGWQLERVARIGRSEEHTSELQSPCNLVCRLLLEKKKAKISSTKITTRPARSRRTTSRSEVIHRCSGPSFSCFSQNASLSSSRSSCCTRRASRHSY